MYNVLVEYNFFSNESISINNTLTAIFSIHRIIGASFDSNPFQLSHFHLGVIRTGTVWFVDVTTERREVVVGSGVSSTGEKILDAIDVVCCFLEKTNRLDYVVVLML